MINNLNLLSILLYKITHTLLGIGTIFIIIFSLSPNIQGWYYTMLSIASLYVLFEFGLSNLLIFKSANYFSKLKWSSSGIEGDKDIIEEFYKFFKSSILLYVYISTVSFIIIYPIGSHILEKNDPGEVINNWKNIWFSLILFTSLNLASTSVLHIYEGSGKIKEIYFLRTGQQITGVLITWLLLINDYQVASLLALPGSCLAIFIIWLYTYGKEVRVITKNNITFNAYDWRKSIGYLRLQIGCSTISLYIITQTIVPFIFYFTNPVLAGQIALTVTACNMLSLICISWIQQNIPLYSSLAASNDTILFNKIYFKNALQSIALYFISLIIIYLIVFYINPFNIMQRFSTIDLFIYLAIYFFIYHVLVILVNYSRVYLNDKLYLPLIASSVIHILVMIIGLSYYDVETTVSLIGISLVLIILPYSFYIIQSSYKHTNG